MDILDFLIDTTVSQAQTSGIPFLSGTLNINDLYQRLVASGIVPPTANMNATKTENKEEMPIFDVDFSDVNTLKK